ncbi:MAG: hypothetical protein WDA03_12300 [Trueperaceae bacterium]
MVPAAALALLVVAMLSAALAQDGHSGHATTQFVAVDYAFEGPNQLGAGWHNISLRNDGAELHHLQFARLNDGVTPDQFFQALAEQGEAALALAALTGGVGIIPPGASAEVLVDFTQPGTARTCCCASCLTPTACRTWRSVWLPSCRSRVRSRLTPLTSPPRTSRCA